MSRFSLALIAVAANTSRLLHSPMISVSSVAPAASAMTGHGDGRKGASKTKRMSAQAATTERTTPVALARMPSMAYSLSMILPIWPRVAPSVLSSTPSRMRCRRDAPTAPSITRIPVATLNSAMKRIATAMRSTIAPTARCTADRSMLETFE